MYTDSINYASQWFARKKLPRAYAPPFEAHDHVDISGSFVTPEFDALSDSETNFLRPSALSETGGEVFGKEPRP